MRGVEIDVEAQTARVAAGTLWLEVTEASTPHGLFPLSGSSPDVGVVGYTLGGGLSWLARKHGLAANHVTAIELVTPDGELRPRDRRGARRPVLGGPRRRRQLRRRHRAGVPPVPVRHGLRGHDAVPVRAPRRGPRAWRDWTATAPEEITTSFRIMHLPPLPELPPFLSGRSVVVIDGAYAGDAEAGAEALAALRALEPEMDTWAPASPAALSRIHMDPEEPMPARSETAVLGALDAEGRATFAAHVQPGAPLLFAELRHLGGALARTPEGAGAMGALAGKYLIFSAGLVMAPEMDAAVQAGLAAFLAALQPYATGTEYLNFVERATDAATFYETGDYARLRAIRAAVDPDGVMVANHAIPAAA